MHDLHYSILEVRVGHLRDLDHHLARVLTAEQSDQRAGQRGEPLDSVELVDDALVEERVEERLIGLGLGDRGEKQSGRAAAAHRLARKQHATQAACEA